MDQAANGGGDGLPIIASTMPEGTLEGQSGLGQGDRGDTGGKATCCRNAGLCMLVNMIAHELLARIGLLKRECVWSCGSACLRIFES
jgi:hypothetical protein